jgi:hypothetical protein
MDKKCEYVGSADGASDDRLGSRAMAAYWRTEQTPQQPNEPDLYTVDGKAHVVLANASRLLAVYRVKNDGALRRLRRIPACLITAVEG